MSIKVMSRVWAHSQQKGGELLVMLALADFANDAGESYPSIPVLAQKARLSDRQTMRVLSTLQASGELQRSRSTGGRHRRSRYRITVTENPDKITVTKLQGKNNSEILGTETVTPMSPALNRHRTVNKNTGAKAPEHSAIAKQRKLTRRGGVPPDPAQFEAFARFYVAYPRHVARQAAEEAWLMLSPSPELQTSIMAGEARYATENENVEKKFILHPATWLNGRRWEDEPANSNGHSDGPPKIAKREGDMLTLADGTITPAGTYQRKYGIRP